MPNFPITSDDVVVGTSRRTGIPFLLRVEITPISVAGRDYEVTTIRLLGKVRTEVRTTVVTLHSPGTEQAIAALLDTLNAQPGPGN